MKDGEKEKKSMKSGSGGKEEKRKEVRLTQGFFDP